MNLSESKELIERKKVKVLVVDDDKISRTLIKTMMMKNSLYFDLEIDEAHDGKDWMDKINLWDYDVVFLDYHMPRMNGIECLKGITNPNKPNVIMVTGAGKWEKEWEGVLKMAYENEVYNYLSKPIDTFSVTQIWKNALNDAIQKRELRERERQLTLTLWEIHETKERIDLILDGFLSHETIYIDSINNRKFPLFDIAVFQKAYDRWSWDIFLHNKFRERHILSFSLFDISWHSLETSVDAQHVKLLRMSEMSHPIKNRPYHLEELVYILNDKIKNAFSGREKRTYSTFAEVRFNMEKNILEVVNCGSEAPMIIRKNGVVEKIKSQSMPLGMVGNLEYTMMFQDFVEKKKFERWDRFFMSSDGLLEAEDYDGRKFIDVVPHIIKKYKHLTVDEMKNKLLEYYLEHTGSPIFSDDVTFSVMKVRDDYDTFFINFTHSLDYILSQLELTTFSGWLANDDFEAHIKETLVKIIQDIYENNTDGSGFLIEYKMIPEKRCMEIIIDLWATSCNVDYIDGYMKDEATDKNHMIAHLIEKTDKMMLMKESKQVVLNFVY